MTNLALHNHHLYANSYMQGYVMRKQHHIDEKQLLVSGAGATGPRNLKVVNKMRQPLPQGRLSPQLNKTLRRITLPGMNFNFLLLDVRNYTELPCSTKNCEHVCIALKVNSQADLSAACFCELGFTLDADGVTCSGGL